MPGRRPAVRGALLAELLVGLTIVAILAGLALPAFHQLVRTYRIRTTAHDLQTELGWARGEAMRRGQTVALAFEPATGCAFPPATPRQRCAWAVFVDDNGDRTRQPAEPVLRVGSAPPGVAVTHAAGGEITGFDRWGNIQPLGGHFAVAAAGAGAGDGSARVVCFSAGGRMRLAAGTGC